MKKKLYRHSREVGFTIIELMIVLAIIAGIISLVAVNMGGKADSAKAQMADTQMRVILAGIDRFRSDTKRYPNNIKELSLDRSQKPSDVKRFFGPYVNAEALVDPWGNEYVLRKGTGGKPELVSYAADGKSGGTGEDADIVVSN